VKPGDNRYRGVRTFVAALGIVDYTSRLAADVVKTCYARNANEGRSRSLASPRRVRDLSHQSARIRMIKARWVRADVTRSSDDEEASGDRHQPHRWRADPDGWRPDL
jgi:hypothetical protein